jgi:hypothetical protein
MAQERGAGKLIWMTYIISGIRANIDIRLDVTSFQIKGYTQDKHQTNKR